MTTRRAFSRDELLPLCGLLGVGLLVHAHELTGGHLFVRDAHRMFVPAKHFIAETLKKGQWPEWWPYDGGGSPLIAQSLYSFFHPTTLFYALLSFWPAFTLQTLTGTLLALFGTYGLARELGQERESAFIAASLYGACGCLVSITEFTFTLLSAGALPWYAWALLVAERRRGAWMVLPPLALALLLFGGEPEIAIIAAAIGAVLLLGDRGLSRWTIALGVLSPLVAAMVAACQLLPSLLLVPETERAGHMLFAQKWPLNWQHVLGLALPVRQDVRNELISSTYLGLSGAFLALASLSRAGTERRVRVLLGVAVASLWIGLGDAYGLHWIVRHVVPLWSMFRFPVKLAVPLSFALALLAGEGWGAIASVATRKSGIRLGLGLLLAGLLFGLAFDHAAWRSLTVGCVAVLVAVIGLSSPSVRRSWLAAALIAVELVASTLPLTRTVDGRFFAASVIARVLKREHVGLLGPSFERFDERRYTASEEPYADAAAVGGRGLSFGALFDLPDLTYYTPGASRRVRTFFQERIPVMEAARLYGIFGAGYLVESAELAATGHQDIVGREPRFGYAVVRQRHALPRAYAVHRALPVPDVEAARARLFSDAFKPGREITVETTESHPDWSDRPDRLAVPVRIVGRTNTRVRLDATLPWPGFVVLNETLFRGWTARVDGVAAPVYYANGFVRAVPVSPGHHSIEFDYATPGLRTGLFVSALSLAFLLLCALVLRRRPSYQT